MDPKNSNSNEINGKKRGRGRPSKSEHSFIDKRERIGEALSLHLQGYSWVDVRNHHREKYNISERTASDDCKQAKELKDKKIEPQEDAWLRQVVDDQFRDIENLKTDIDSMDSDIARTQGRKLLKELKQYLWENFLIPNYFKKLKAPSTEGMNSIAAYQALLMANDANIAAQREAYLNGDYDIPQ